MASREQRATEGGEQQEIFASVARSRGFVPFFEDPFKQGLVLSGGSMVALQKVHPPSVQPYPPQSRAEFRETASSYCPSPTESSTLQSIGGFSDVRMLSPAFSSQGDRWSQQSISRLFSHSTGGEEFDQASLSNHMSSLAEDIPQHGPPLFWWRHNKLVAFLAAAVVICISAVMVDMTWTILSRGNTRQLQGEARSHPYTEPTEGDSLHQYAPLLKLPSETEIKPFPKSTPRFSNSDSEATVYHKEVKKPPVRVMVITQSPSKVATKKRSRGPPRVTRYLSRLSTWKRRRTFIRVNEKTARRHGDIEAESSRRLAAMRRRPKRMCGSAFYTYCPKLRHEAYYRHSTRTCIRTITDNVHVCNRSPNKFATLGECQRSCVNTRLPSVACFEMPLFFSCSRRDVNASWWVFDHQQCRPWEFPAGLCPRPADRDVFRSRLECIRSCLAADVHSRGRATPCRAPGVGVTCDASVLRFPYFAYKPPGGNGRVRCIRTSAAALFAHRCLIGSNRFFSEAACQSACLDDAWLEA
ncbi:uncharacterized protein [Dermacentor albipictus]|uniref:uncharacterized protein n=1 Tax=Dermacentor albipictus TaxID=60249 RepID=UPI0038FC930F